MKKSIFLILNFFCLAVPHHSFAKDLFGYFEDWHDCYLSSLSQEELNKLLNPQYPQRLALIGGLTLGTAGALSDYILSFNMSKNNGSLKAYFQDHVVLILFAVAGLWLGHWRGLRVQRKIKNGEIPI
jgi:hypothetical protein